MIWSRADANVNKLVKPIHQAAQEGRSVLEVTIGRQMAFASRDLRDEAVVGYDDSL